MIMKDNFNIKIRIKNIMKGVMDFILKIKNVMKIKRQYMKTNGKTQETQMR